MRRLYATFVVVFAAANLFAQTGKATLTLCEKVDTDGTTTQLPSYAKPVNPTKSFKPMGELTNVHVVATFKPMGKEQTLVIKVLTKDGEEERSTDLPVTPESTWVFTGFTMNKAGEYTMKLIVKSTDEVLAEEKFTVLPDDKGPRANGDQPSGQGFLWICESTDDDWKPVGATGDPTTKDKEHIFTWPADKGFNILVKNKAKVPFGTLFLGIVIHNQGADGKDIGFVNEWQSDQLEENKATMWATVEPLTNLKAGRYTVYVIDWYTREATEHNGNLKQYYAKVTLIVK